MHNWAIKRGIAQFLLAATLCMAVHESAAQETDHATSRQRRTSFIGERYFSIDIGENLIGDNETLKEISDTVMVTSSHINFPLHRNFDMMAVISRQKWEGWDDNGKWEYNVQSVMAGVRWHLRPGQIVDPYVSTLFGQYRSLLELKDSLEYEILSNRATHNAMIAGVGAEVSLGNGKFLTPSVSYYEIGSYADGALGCSFNKWLKQKFGVGFAASRDFKDRDLYISMRICFSL
ncbi:MAG: hypothetical protein JXN60_05760 [Lentisphaerae bacterium]|nr:hypothetical protein [Lentisphaerota bacterium]